MTGAVANYCDAIIVFCFTIHHFKVMRDVYWKRAAVDIKSINLF